MADALETITRIRSVAVEDAKRELALRLRSEEAARLDADAAEARIVSEGEAAADLAASDEVVEAYAAWLPTGRARVAAARAAQDQARCDVALARAALTVAQSAAAASKKMLETRTAEQTREAERRSQAAMDEVATRRSFYG